MAGVMACMPACAITTTVRQSSSSTSAFGSPTLTGDAVTVTYFSWGGSVSPGSVSASDNAGDSYTQVQGFQAGAWTLVNFIAQNITGRSGLVVTITGGGTLGTTFTYSSS